MFPPRFAPLVKITALIAKIEIKSYLKDAHSGLVKIFNSFVIDKIIDMTKPKFVIPT